MLLKIMKLSVLLGILLGIAFSIQTGFFSEGFPESKMKFIKFGYFYNYTFSLLLLTNFIIFYKRLIEIAGFLFLGAGVIKIGIFYFLANQSESDISKSTFLLFFIPFLICLLVEVIYLVRELDRANFNNDN